MVEPELPEAAVEGHPRSEPEAVKVHDFNGPVLGKANPYGVYDIVTSTGWVSVGTDHDAAAFAVTPSARAGTLREMRCTPARHEC